MIKMREGTITKAIGFAKEAHKGQIRKYTGEPYYTHPLEVARILNDFGLNITQEQIVAALLHDTVEDCDVTVDDIRIEFGVVVANYVFFLSDISKPEDGNRSIRKNIDRLHISKAPKEVKTVKLADLIHNTKSIVKYDKNFAKIYMKEKLLLLEVLKDGDPILFEKASKLVMDYYIARLDD